MHLAIAFSLVLVSAAQPNNPDNDAGRSQRKKEFRQRKDALKGTTDPHPYCELGDWALANNLLDEAKQVFEMAWGLKPGLERARQGMNRLGYDSDDGKTLRPSREVIQRKRAALAAADADGRYQLSLYATNLGLKPEAQALLEEALKVDPDHKPTRQLLGFVRYYGQWLTLLEMDTRKREDLAWKNAVDAGKSPEETWAVLKPGGWAASLDEVKQVLAWAKAPTGVVQDQKLADPAFAGAEYSYGTPSLYRPWRKTPVIVFLHDGGADTGDGDDCLGAVHSMAGPRGYFTICPTVLEKKQLAWNDERHVAYLKAIVKEFSAAHHVDERRIYLAGHAMGGYGTWYLGSRLTKTFAALSAWSCAALDAKVEDLANTPVYVLHSAKDPTVDVARAREVVAKLVEKRSPHVYVELDVETHAIPDAAQVKAVEWFDRHALPAPKKK
jgi:predicted esterase